MDNEQELIEKPGEPKNPSDKTYHYIFLKESKKENFLALRSSTTASPINFKTLAML